MPARWTKAREEVPRMHDNPRRQPEPLADYPVFVLPGTITERILSFDDDFDEFSQKLQQLSKEWDASSVRESQLRARVSRHAAT